ncbi:MAG: fatty acid desaturase [Planctomycetes bacterium]|nr:fatty acid desaturase [Planctomycetota bacterium]
MIGADALLVLLAAFHGALALALPCAPLLALGLWWNANTVSHNFIHRPFFRRQAGNVCFSVYLSVLLGIPQSLWRKRHLAHHAGRDIPWRLDRQDAAELALLLGLWGGLCLWSPGFFIRVYLPGYLAGLFLCYLQGRYEHLRGTVSHYGKLYNWLFFNDGYHVEHHADPSRPWTRLPACREEHVRSSPWPAVLRWLEFFSLCGLERWVLKSRLLQQFVLRSHEQAFQRLLPALPPVRRVGIVGGGLFPRTVLILRRLLPEAQLVVIDADQDHLRLASEVAGDGVEWIHRRYDADSADDFDLLILPLSFIGDRAAVYRRPSRPVLVQDWIWRRRGRSALVSLALLKCVNLVTP